MPHLADRTDELSLLKEVSEQMRARLQGQYGLATAVVASFAALMLVLAELEPHPEHKSSAVVILFLVIVMTIAAHWKISHYSDQYEKYRNERAKLAQHFEKTWRYELPKYLTSDERSVACASSFVIIWSAAFLFVLFTIHTFFWY